MHCSYCGIDIGSDDVVREQRVGLSTDTDGGQIFEVERFVSSVACDSCGTVTEHEFNCSDNLIELDTVYYDEESRPSS
jgi:hypothetical protein